MITLLRAAGWDDVFGAFFVGVVITVLVVLYLRDAEAFEKVLLAFTHKIVPPKSIAYGYRGEVFEAGQPYPVWAVSLIIFLERRMISEPRYFSVFYEPDPAKIHTFVRTLREASGGAVDFAKLDAFITSKFVSRLQLEARPDCAKIATAYGVIFSDFVFPEVIEPEPKDERDRVERLMHGIVQGSLANVGGYGTLAGHIELMEAGEHPKQKEHPILLEPENKKAAVDILRAALKRAKTAQ
jgi:hypothetical protein